jgi:methylenetetrahydrofolate reductase (NADPH)
LGRQRPPRVFSVELFPPKTPEGLSKLQAACDELAALNRDYFSVTTGAGGAPPERTYETVKEIRARLGAVDTVPHIACIGSSRESVRRLLEAYAALGIRHIVAIRGGLPAGTPAFLGELRHACDLVALIRASTGDYFQIEVAAYSEFHPEAASPLADLENFRRKVQAGATAALTQYFYNPDAYFRFVESCERLGVLLPIVPGIMPITNYERLARFSDAVGVEIPRWLRLEGLAGRPESLREFGIDVVTRLCERLLEWGAPGLHFYTMNTAEPTRSIWTRLGLRHLTPARRDHE